MINKTARSDLKFSSKNEILKPVVKVGEHMLTFLDNDLVKQLEIKEGDICTQTLEKDDTIVLRIKKISKRGHNIAS
jgi:hypothetical protein